MKINTMPQINRDCPHCGEKGTLNYYHEAIGKTDEYYCEKCYKIVLWNGQRVTKISGEAYPNRDKSLSTPVGNEEIQ